MKKSEAILADARLPGNLGASAPGERPVRAQVARQVVEQFLVRRGHRRPAQVDLQHAQHQVQLGAPRLIRDAGSWDGGPGPVMMEMARSGAMPVEPGSLSLSHSVTVIFGMSEAAE